MLERLDRYLGLMRRVGRTGAHDLIKEALSASRSRESLLRRALSIFADPTDAWAALQDALRVLARDPHAPPQALEVLKAAVEALEGEHGPAIRAGLHGALAAEGREALGDVRAARDLYRNTVCAFSTVEQVFDSLRERYGDANFDAALDFLHLAVGSDLSSDMPSMDKIRLESVITSLGKVRLVKSAHVLCVSVMSRWAEVHGVADCPLTARELLARVLAMRSERFLGAAHVERVAEEAGAPDIEREVLFLQELLRMVRDVPPELFDGAAGRMRLMDAVQEAVDNAVEREECGLGGKEEGQ